MAKAKIKAPVSKCNMGRPSEFTQEVADRVCAEISGGASLRKVCAADDMPVRVTIYKWMNEHERFMNHYARACLERAHHLAEDALAIADEAVPTVDGRMDGAAVQNKRVRIETRKWFAAKLYPKMYGEKVAQEVTGPEGAPIALNSILTPIDYGAVIAGLKRDYGAKSARSG